LRIYSWRLEYQSGSWVQERAGGRLKHSPYAASSLKAAETAVAVSVEKGSEEAGCIRQQKNYSPDRQENGSIDYYHDLIEFLY